MRRICPSYHTHAHFTHHCHSVGAQELLRTQCCGVGHVGKHINKCDHRDGDEDRTWQIPKRMSEEEVGGIIMTCKPRGFAK